MPYPLHIAKPATIVAHGGTPSTGLQQYVDRLVRLIPAEVVAVYQAARGIVESAAPADPSAKAFIPWLPVIGFILVLLVRAWGTRAPTGDWSTVQWAAVGIAAVSFAAWVLSLGHPIIAPTPIPTWIGSIVLIGWVFFLPYVYEGD